MGEGDPRKPVHGKGLEDLKHLADKMDVDGFRIYDEHGHLIYDDVEEELRRKGEEGGEG